MSYADRRAFLEEKIMHDNSYKELYEKTSGARMPIVVDIRTQYLNTGMISRKQAQVLAGWLAEERLEYGDEEDDDES